MFSPSFLSTFVSRVSVQSLLELVVVLVDLQDLAEQEGDAEKAKSLAEKLQELEERADQLDKQRTKGLSAIRLHSTHL